MFKKSLFTLLCAAIGSHCFANNIEAQNDSAEPKYKISETDMRILVRQLNNIEQCIYPELGEADYQKIYDSWGAVENITMFYFERQLLKELVGEQNANFIHEDPASKKYFDTVHKKVNHQKAYVDKDKCEAFKHIYQDITQKVRASLPAPIK